MSQSELARMLAAVTGNKVESERSQIRFYLKAAKQPTPARAALIAELLDAPAVAVTDRMSRRDREVADLRDRVRALERLLDVQPGEPPPGPGGMLDGAAPRMLALPDLPESWPS